MKKISNIIIVLVLTFAFTFALPQKEADAVAWGLAVPGGITVGAGAYYIAAVGLAGIVGIAGYDTYSEEINAHALRAWENGTQLSKDSMNIMINSAKDLGNVLTANDADFNTWMDSQIDALFQTNVAFKYDNITSQTGYLVKKANATTTSEVATQDDAKFLVNGSAYSRLIVYKNANYFDVWVTGLTAGTGATTAYLLRSTNPNFYDDVNTQLRNMIDPYAYVALVKTIGLTTGLGYGSYTDYSLDYATGISQTREAWQDMKDAGLVLPVDSAIPVYQGNAVNYNAETDVYTGVDGGVINPADLVWSFPQPRIRTGEELDVAVPPGVYVDNPSGVYSPSLPTTAFPDIAVPTTTNITTGVTTEIPKTGTGEPPPTGGTTPKGEPINPFKGVVPGASLLSLFQLLVAIIWYLIRMFTFLATIAFIAPTPIDNPYFMWFTTAEFYGITPFPLVQNLALFFLGFSIYKSIRRVF